MTNEIIFDEATKPYGGRLKYRTPKTEQIILRVNSLLAAYSNDDKLLKPFPKIIFDFVDNHEFNAFAMKYNDNYIIGVNEAVELILFDLFNRMLSHRDILPNIGDISLEHGNESLNDYYANVNEMVRLGHPTEYKFIYPKDTIRAQYAVHLTRISLDFIFEHELSHILFGHVDFINKKYGFNRLSESYDQNTISNNIDLQTFEMDADCTALARCCNLALNIFKKPTRIHSDFQKFYTNIYSVLNDINFSICNMLTLFSDGDFKNITPGKSSHPDTRVRQLMLLATFLPIVKKWNIEIDGDILQKSLAESFKQTVQAYEMITGKTANMEVFQKEYFTNNPHVKIVLDNWKNNIRSKLMEHTFKPLAE